MRCFPTKSELRMKSSTLVSVIMPCFRMGQFVQRALRAIGAQSHSSWELIVIDDCGPEDGTISAVLDFQASHSQTKVKLIRHKKNQGVSAARNTALRSAKGNLIAFLDPDDFWHEDYLATMLEALSSSNADLAFCRMMVVDAQGDYSHVNASPTELEIDRFPQSLYEKNFIGPSCVVAKAKCFEVAGYFDEDPQIQHVEDWDLWIRFVTNKIRFEFVETPLCFYRKHSGAATLASYDTTINRRRALWRKHIANFDLMCSLIDEHVATKQKLFELQRRHTIKSRISECAKFPVNQIRRLFRL